MKSGVSLITVLLFMLVATIAATATFKWINSEGRSSASRMLERAAYQSSIAGIENARAWMTFHANDVGALIRQYLSDANRVVGGAGRQSINLDSRLRLFQRPGQEYHVWLAGVNVENSTYKLKIISSGEASNGTRHNEVAIFNVDGLYQVSVPQIEHHSHINFDFAYYGGSYTSSGKTVMTSGVVNGSWSGNPPTVERNWIVTGNAILSGSDLTVGQTACIGGNASIENNGITTTDLYVGGAFDGLVKRATGSVYFDKFARHTGTGSMIIDGNLTVNGKYITAQNASNRATRVGGNLCVSDSGTVVSAGTSDVFQVSGNVWMPGPQNLWYGSTDSCVCEVFDKSNNGRFLRTEICKMNNGYLNYNWPEAGYIVKCGRLVASNDQMNTNQGSYEKIILGDSASKVFINSALSSAAYSSLRSSKTFRETSTYKKNCPSKLSSDDYWKIEVYPGSRVKKFPADDKNICGYWGNPHWESWLGGAYYVKYTKGWENWSGDKPYIYSSVGTASDKYAMYYTGGVTDVTFALYNLENWKYYTADYSDAGNKREIKTTCSGHCDGNGEWYDFDGSNGWFRDFTPDASQIAEKFTSPTPVGGYLVGGEIFYDQSAYKGYHYDNEGNKATGSPYCKHGSDDFRPVCGVTPWFKATGTVLNSMPTDREFTCAESVMQDCFDIWEPANGCEGTKFFVDDPLVTAYDDYEPFAHVGCAANITTWPQSGFEKKLNDCYSENASDPSKRETNLYNGYLVVHITGSNPGYNYGVDASTPLSGKFIIIVDNRVKAQNGFPKTTADSKVFLYLEQGSDKIQGTLEHYFIYTKVNTGTSDQLNLTGTLYSPAELCVTNRFQSSTLTFDADLVQDLTDAGVICQNDGNSGCSPAGSGTGSSSSGGVVNPVIINGGRDSYYISMAPQLGVSVETQYETRESPPADTALSAPLDSSFIILPRVIYLPRDPYGKLSDYYNVVPLNGSTVTQERVNVQCAPVLPTEGSLYAGGVLLDERIYRCTGSAANHASVPFWVVASGTLRGTPQVSFVEAVQEMGPTASAQVHANIPPHASPLTVLVACPIMPSGWSYTMNDSLSPSISNGTCSFQIQAGMDGEVRLFNVNTSSASNGTVVFQLLAGEGYALSSPFTSELHVSNVATINRVDPSPEEIDEYCNNNPEDCPEAGLRGSEWPDCNVQQEWVEPSAKGSTVDLNNAWTVPAGGSGSLTLVEKSPAPAGCVVIIPVTDNFLQRDTIVADQYYELKAIAKARKSSVKVGFVGNVGSGNNPHIVIDANSRVTTCYYNNVKDSDPKACTVDLFSGETVNVSIQKSSGENENFNYWKCENNGGVTCPTTDPISSSDYPSFTIKDNKAVIFGHFGEVDEHCFFDEFKRGGVECQSNDDQYCIDKCGTLCVGAVDAGGSFTKAKWHLVAGSLDNIEDSYESISIDKAANGGSNRSNRDAVKVMSTTQPGLRGTLKALVQLPKATSSYGKTASNIAKSGFMLHSNAAGTEFLMLNVFVNTSGELEADVCVDGGTESCFATTPRRNGDPLSVAPSSMVMVEAVITDTNTIELTVFSGNYYGEPDTYTSSIKLYELSTLYISRDHEYIGFSMADPNFKIYGIGWSSEEYGADECWDTYPTVKCSFAAKAVQGVIPTDTTVEPWVGHSGWFDSKNCTPVYYYYNGTDACSGQEGVESSCPAEGYYFSQTGAGQHGYRDNGVDVKAAKAWLSCVNSDDQTVAWSAGTENLRAHCGLFWTGKFTECVNHANLGTLSSVGSELEGTITLTGTTNLRAAKLNIVLENPNSSEVLVWLLSENAAWGANGFASNAVRFTGTNASFDVMETFADGAQGFDPEHVKQVVVKNVGADAVTNVSVTSSCKNAVGISNCQVAYNEQSGKWEVSADVTNKDKVSSYAVTGQVSSSDVVTSTSEPGEWAVDRATWKIDHNPYASYQGSTFDFTASVTNASGETLSASCGSVTIGSITCSNYSANNVQSGAPWPAFNFRLNGCPQNNCEYDILFDGTLLSGNSCTTGACSGTGYGSLTKTKSGNAEECTTNGGCSHKYKVQSSDEENKPFTPCEVTFTVQPRSSSSSAASSSSSAPPSSSSAPPSSSSAGGSATCAWENGATSFWPGQQNVKLIVSNIQGLASDANFTLTCGTASTSSTCRVSGSCDNLQFSVPSTVGTYTCTLKNSTMTLCTPSLEVKAPLSCSVTTNTVDYGGKFKFTGKTATSSCHNCKLYRGNNEYQYIDNQSNIENYEITFNWSVPKTFTYECQCDNMASSANKCSQTVASQVNPPTFDCKTGLKATIDESNNVTIGLENVVGCHEGSPWCHYSITGTGISEKTGTGISNGTVNLGAFTDNGTDGSSKTYSVTLENSAGVSASKNCSVEFTAGSSAIPVTISYQDYKSFTPGNTYTLTFSGSRGGVFRCTYTDRAYSFKMGVYDGSDWNVGANTGGQATKSNPGNGAVKTFVVDSDAPTDLKCATDW